MTPPPRRRRSSRLAAAASKTPSKPVVELEPLAEENIAPEPFPVTETPARRKVKAALEAAFVSAPSDSKPTTPVSSALKPPYSAMHPNHCHSSMHTVAPSSALRLGFSDIRPSKRDSLLPAAIQDTPSKLKVPEAEFTFQDDRAAQIMAEIKAQSVKYKASLIAEREKKGAEEGDFADRKIAQPKPKAGRFSAAHIAEFAKMDSIVGHASAWRANRTTPTPVKQGLKRSHSKADLTATPTGPSIKTNLKRRPSKNTLNDEPGQTPSKIPSVTAQTPARKTLKRSSDVANLDGVESTRKTEAAAPSSVKPHVPASVDKSRPNSFMGRMLQKQQERIAASARPAGLPVGNSVLKQTEGAKGAPAAKATVMAQDCAPSGAKRIKKNHEDDTSTNRPVSRDGSALPRAKPTGSVDAPSGTSGTLPKPQLGLSRLMSPTKSFMAHSAAPTKPTASTTAHPAAPAKPTGSLIPSPSKSKLVEAAKPTLPASTPSAIKSTESERKIASPSRLQRVKSILRAPGVNLDAEGKTGIPKPGSLLATSHTPAPSRVSRDIPQVPFTTPRRQLKKVAFTPDTKRCPDMQELPSPGKTVGFMERISRISEQPHEPVDEIMGESTPVKEARAVDCLYPDLSGFKGVSWTPDEKRKSLPKSVPGTFTFRSDKTIDFGTPPVGFGASPGQASLRQVRESMAPKAQLPGSFPAPSESNTNSDKENTVPPIPQVMHGVPHGMANKKRHRPTWDEEDVEKEATDRAAKKRRNDDVPEGEALLAPRQPAQTPRQPVQTPARSTAKKAIAGRVLSRTPGSATPSRKVGLSMSRLQMLARPKNRG